MYKRERGFAIIQSMRLRQYNNAHKSLVTHIRTHGQTSLQKHGNPTKRVILQKPKGVLHSFKTFPTCPMVHSDVQMNKQRNKEFSPLTVTIENEHTKIFPLKKSISWCFFFKLFSQKNRVSNLFFTNCNYFINQLNSIKLLNSQS